MRFRRLLDVFFLRGHCTPRSGVSGIVTCGSIQGRRGRAVVHLLIRRGGTDDTAKGGGQRGAHGRGGEHSGRSQAGFPGSVPAASDFGRHQAWFRVQSQPRRFPGSSTGRFGFRATSVGISGSSLGRSGFPAAPTARSQSGFDGHSGRLSAERVLQSGAFVRETVDL